MRKIFNTLLIISVLFLNACVGEDRSYQYEALTQHNQWIYEVMSDKYLWADNIQEPAWKKFFGKPSTFLDIITAYGKNDKWSFLTVDTTTTDVHPRGNYNHLDSYGFDFSIMTDPTSQSTRSYARVVTVYDNSPAQRCGLKRGDFIYSFDNNKITSSNSDKLVSGAQRALVVCHLDYNEESQTFLWKDTVEYTLPKSTVVEDVAFPVHNVRDTLGVSIGYLMCNRLLVGNGLVNRTVADSSYVDSLDKIMNEFKNVEISELVLDLRLANDGTLDMMRRLASYIIAPSALDNVLAKTKWNEKNSENNVSVMPDKSVGNLGLGRVFIITSAYTQGAAEWLIHALKSAMGSENVCVIGQTTAGQNVMTQLVGYNYLVKLSPVVAYVADGIGDYDYGSGITPDVEINEFNYVNLYPYGDYRETLLSTAYSYVAK